MDLNNESIRKPSGETRVTDNAIGFSSPSLRLYSDRHPWPLRCPHCSTKFVERIKSLRTRSVVRCPTPECHSVVERDPNFALALSQARSGSFDPFKHVWGKALAGADA
jgi:hypothetical protein